MERLARLAGIKAQIGTSADQETMVASRHWCMQRTANAVAESFFNPLKREWMRRWVYRTRTEARQGVFYYIEMFCNPHASMRGTVCCHSWSSNGSGK